MYYYSFYLWYSHSVWKWRANLLAVAEHTWLKCVHMLIKFGNMIWLYNYIHKLKVTVIVTILTPDRCSELENHLILVWDLRFAASFSPEDSVYVKVEQITLVFNIFSFIFFVVLFIWEIIDSGSEVFFFLSFQIVFHSRYFFFILLPRRSFLAVNPFSIIILVPVGKLFICQYHKAGMVKWPSSYLKV